MNWGKILLSTVIGASFGAAAIPAGAFTNYVDANSVSPIAPYTNWNTAAQTIQQAVDVCPGGGVVIVTNGVYQNGGRSYPGALTNRVTVTNAISLRSVNGPEVTMIVGSTDPNSTNGPTAVRCLFMTNEA